VCTLSDKFYYVKHLTVYITLNILYGLYTVLLICDAVICRKLRFYNSINSHTKVTSKLKKFKRV